MKEEKIDEAAASAFYREQQGEDVSKEKEYYRNALERIKAEVGDFPVCVKEWHKK